MKTPDKNSTFAGSDNVSYRSMLKRIIIRPMFAKFYFSACRPTCIICARGCVCVCVCRCVCVCVYVCVSNVLVFCSRICLLVYAYLIGLVWLCLSVFLS